MAVDLLSGPQDLTQMRAVLNNLINAFNAYTAAEGAVDSVNGQTGTVVLTAADITPATNANYVTDTELVNVAALPNISGNAASATAVAVGGITGLGANVATALAVAVGSAGAPVVLNGALGTPSSGVATNLTGTAAGLTAGSSVTAGIAIPLPTKTIAFTATLPANKYIISMSIVETAGHAITDGLKCGTTLGGNEVFDGLAVGANSLQVITGGLGQTIDVPVFSISAPTTLYFDAVTAWNSASINVNIVYGSL